MYIFAMSKDIQSDILRSLTKLFIIQIKTVQTIVIDIIIDYQQTSRIFKLIGNWFLIYLTKRLKIAKEI